MNKNDKIYKVLKARMREISVVPPQNVGPFTFIYKQLVPYFKFYPWKSAVLISGLFSVLLYLLFGPSLIKLVSLLQFGF